MAALVCRLLPAVRATCTGTVLSSRLSRRSFSCSGSRSRLQAGGSGVLAGRTDRFGGVTVNLEETELPEDISEGAFSDMLRDALAGWRAEGKVAVWLRVPIALSRCAAAASAHGFSFHHAKQDHTVLTLWLAPGISRLPGYATHQVGVAGAVVDESTGNVLVVQDKNKTKNAWKFPGGLSDPGENIGVTAVREVLEETGVRSEFRSLLSVRQQHGPPGAFGMSDMYLICRLSPLTFHIQYCREECERCEWLPLSELARTDCHPPVTTPITSRVARLLLLGLQHGFQHVDLSMEQLPAVHAGMFYQLYHRPLPPH